MRTSTSSLFVPAWAIAVTLASCAHAPTRAGPANATRSHVASAPPRVTQVAIAAAPARSASTSGPAPRLLVHVDRASDGTRALPARADLEITRSVQRALEDHEYATAWPGGAPRSADLDARGARAFIVVPTVQSVVVARKGDRASIECRVGIRIAPWRGVDGGERWEVDVAASATGAARATTSSRDAAIEAGIGDCVRELAEQLATNRIVPFLQNVVR
jgi:hypothetical protein